MYIQYQYVTTLAWLSGHGGISRLRSVVDKTTLLDVDVADIVLDPESQFPVAHLMNPSQPSHVGTPTPGFLHLLRDRNTQMPNHTRLLSALDNVKIGFPIG